MAASPSLAPIRADRFNEAHARHLLARAGFGGTPAQVRALAHMGLDAAVDLLVDFHHIDAGDLPAPVADPDIIRPPGEEERRRLAQARRAQDREVLDRFMAERLLRQGEDRQQMRRLEHWWLGRLIATPRPLEEKLVLLWHGHFASNFRTVQDSYLMLQQQALFRAHAAGSFANLLRGIVRDPAMIRFLNNDSNVRRSPNENLARELMELFTLGEGQYRESDIKEGARALTGYGIEDHDFRFRPMQHDGGDKTILGRTGRFDGDAFADLLLGRQRCAWWVAGKLYRHFAGDLDAGPEADVPAKLVIGQLATALWNGRYELRPVLKTLFKSEHFYHPEVMGNQIKGPVQLVVGTVRALDAPPRDLATLADALGLMGQKLFDPPSVAGWDGGRSWINTSTLFVRQNLCAFLLTGKLPYSDGWTTERIEYDPTFLLAGLAERTPEAVGEHLLATLIARPVAADRRETIVEFLRQRRGGINRDALLGALLLITAMPEYQLC